MDFQQCGHKTLKDQLDIILWSDFFIPNVPEGIATETESRVHLKDNQGSNKLFQAPSEFVTALNNWSLTLRGPKNE